MSIITDFLKLFKYDPETDGASTFNIKQCLNDNWDKIDAWASGIKTTIAGLVPGTRKVNGKELSADVTLTGEDIKTSASDETTISSQLSKTIMPAGSDGLIDDISVLISNSFYGISPITGAAGLPTWWPDGRSSIIQFCPPGSQYLIDFAANFTNKRVGYRLLYNGEWFEIATATPPQEFTAPLSDGYSGTLSYLKTQESIVIVSFDVYKTDDSAINGTNLISTLPEGFRGLSGYCAALATGVGGGNIVGAAQAWCDTEGIVRTLCPSGTYRIRGEIVFCAN